MTDSARTRTAFRLWWVIPALGVGVTAAFAWWKAGALDLPPVSPGLTIEAAGLAELEEMRAVDHYVRSTGPAGAGDATGPSRFGQAADLVAQGIREIGRDEAAQGLATMRAGIRLAPDSLPLANAYRMEVFKLRRVFLARARQEAVLTPTFPPHLEHGPIAFFEELVAEHPSRETKLQLALAWVDLMLLFPALEVKAPASVEAVGILTDEIDGGNAGYVPALFARGLNHLHRPARLVWPEAQRTPNDAAVRDIGQCLAIGRKFGVGSKRLQATLATTLGDAYVKAGRFNRARSWWQIAQNLCPDDDLQSSISRRFSWPDGDMLDELEVELDRSRANLVRPLTDLAFMWN